MRTARVRDFQSVAPASLLPMSNNAMAELARGASSAEARVGATYTSIARTD